MSTTIAPTYSEVLARMIADKWQVVHEGPSGAQMKRPRQMMTQTKVCLIVGGVCFLFFWPLGVFLVLIATFDYFVLTKERSHFLARDNPIAPPPK